MNPMETMLAFQFTEVKENLWDEELKVHEKNLQKICWSILSWWWLFWCSMFFEEFYKSSWLHESDIYAHWELAAKRCDQLLYYIAYPYKSRWIIEYEHPQALKKWKPEILAVKREFANEPWLQPLRESANVIMEFDNIEGLCANIKTLIDLQVKQTNS